MSFVVHNSTFDKKYYFENTLNYLEELVASDKVSDLILVVPTNRLVHYYRKFVIKKYSQRYGKPISEINIYNFDDFVTFLFTKLQVNPNYHLLSDGMKMILLEQVINSTPLSYYRYKDNKLRLDIVNQIGEALLNLRKQGLLKTGDNDELLEDYQIIDSDKSNDINKLLNIFDKQLPKDFYDFPKMYAELLKYLSNIDLNDKTNILFNTISVNKHIIFNGFTEFKSTEIAVLSHFAKIRIPTALFFDYSEVYGPVFGNIQDTIAELFASGFELFSKYNIFEEKLDEKLISFHDILKRDLFNIYKSKHLEELQKKVNIYEVSTINDEIKNIVKLIKYLNIERGIKLADIAIVTRKPELYAELIFEKFKSADIPINITHRKTLDNSTLVNLVVLIIKIISQSFTIDELKRVIDSPYLDLRIENPDNFKQVLQLLRIQSNYITFNNNYVVNRAESYNNYLKEQLKIIEDYHYKRYINETIPKIDLFIKDYRRLESLFSQFSNKININKIKQFIEQVILQFGIVIKLQNVFFEISKSTEDYKFHSLNYLYTAYEAEAQALNQLVIVFNDISLWYGLSKDIDKINEVDIAEILERVNVSITHQPYQIKPKDNYGVLFTSIEQIRQLPLKVRILCGANDGIFPHPYSTDKFTGNEVYDSKIKHYRSEKVLFYQFLNFDISSDEEAYIFYPTVSNGTKILPSPFLEHLKVGKKDLNNNQSSIDLSNIIIDKIELTKSKFYQGDYTNNINASSIRKFQLNLNEFDRNYFDSKSYSVGDFETFAKCSYKYYVDKLLNYRIKQTQTDALNFLELGDLYHKILHKFYSEISQNNFSLSNMIKLELSKFDEYVKVLSKIIYAELSNPIYKHPLVKLNTRNLLSNELSINPILRFIKSDIINQAETQNYPVFLEYELKNIAVDNSNGKKIRLNLKIDRVERFDSDYLSYTVADYKLRDNNVNNKKIESLKSFQMPLYLLALQRFFNENNIDSQYQFGIYYFFNYFENEKKIMKVLDDKKKSDLILEESKKEIFRIKHSIIDGLFKLTNNTNDECNFCSFAALCRKNQ